MKDQALVLRVGGKIWLFEDAPRDAQAGLAVAPANILVAFCGEVIAEADEPLRGNSGGGAVNRLPLVERIGGPAKVIAEPMEIRRPGVPHRHAVSARVLKVEIRGGTRC